ncbi:MAG: hypothetical protein RLZZ312_207 [Bacteroidota bacterium]|jgi:hypothetical protein
MFQNLETIHNGKPALGIEALFELFLFSSRLLGRDENKKASAESPVLFFRLP